MGYEKSLVISSRVPYETRQTILESACLQWPFVRLPRSNRSYGDCAIFALPGVRDDPFRDESDLETALDQAETVYNGLNQWSGNFPTVTFAFIEADCFGGICEYEGFSISAGAILTKIEASKTGHIFLLKSLQISIQGHFPPFERGFFQD